MTWDQVNYLYVTPVVPADWQLLFRGRWVGVELATLLKLAHLKAVKYFFMLLNYLVLTCLFGNNVVYFFTSMNRLKTASICFVLYFCSQFDINIFYSKIYFYGNKTYLSKALDLLGIQYLWKYFPNMNNEIFKM